MIYGYCRVSTRKQSLERQKTNIYNFNPAAEIICEKMTGTTCDRPQFNALLDRVQTGDTIIFDSVSRMSRTAAEGFAIYEKLYSQGVNLVFLNERHIDSDSYRRAFQAVTGVQTGDTAADKLVNAVISAVNDFISAKVQDDIMQAFRQSEKEVADIRKRVKDGLREAKAKGHTGGHKAHTPLHHRTEEPTKALIRKYSRDLDGHNNDGEVIAIINASTFKIDGEIVSGHISRNTYYRYKKMLITA